MQQMQAPWNIMIRQVCFGLQQKNCRHSKKAHDAYLRAMVHRQTWVQMLLSFVSPMIQILFRRALHNGYLAEHSLLSIHRTIRSLACEDRIENLSSEQNGGYKADFRAAFCLTIKPWKICWWLVTRPWIDWPQNRTLGTKKNSGQSRCLYWCGCNGYADFLPRATPTNPIRPEPNSQRAAGTGTGVTCHASA